METLCKVSHAYRETPEHYVSPPRLERKLLDKFAVPIFDGKRRKTL
jgi:hypothetical protein